MQILSPHSRPAESETLGVGPSHLPENAVHVTSADAHVSEGGLQKIRRSMLCSQSPQPHPGSSTDGTQTIPAAPLPSLLGSERNQTPGAPRSGGGPSSWCNMVEETQRSSMPAAFTQILAGSWAPGSPPTAPRQNPTGGHLDH